MDVRVQRDVITGRPLPALALPGTDGQSHDLSALDGVAVIYAYPRTSPPDAAPIEGWDSIPGARGCTAQSQGYREHFAELLAAGARHVFGLSTQDTAYQAEAVARLDLPFPLLSDAGLHLTRALQLETFEAGGMVLLRRITLIVKNGVVRHVMFPVTEPIHNASDVVAFLTRHGCAK